MLRRLLPLLCLPLAACDAIATLPAPAPQPSREPVPVAASPGTPAASPRGVRQPAPWEALDAVNGLIQAGRHDEAIARLDQLKRDHPDDPAVGRTRFEALQAEAARRKKAGQNDRALWKQAALTAEETVALHRETGASPNEIPWRLFNALHAYHEGEHYEDVARLGPSLLGEESAVLGGNRIFSYWYTMRANQALGRIQPAREALALAVQYMSQPEHAWAFQTSRELLRADPALTPGEKDAWLARLEPAARRMPEATQLVESYAWLALEQADVRYKRGDYAEALDTYQALSEQFRATLAKQSPALHDNLEMRRACAQFRVSHPGQNGRRVLKATILTAQETDVTAPSWAPAGPASLRRTLDPDAVAHTLESFYWFSETWLPISDGEIRWTYELKEAPRRVVGVGGRLADYPTRQADGSLKTVTSPVLQAEQVEPALEQTDLVQSPDSDMFYLLWPGTPVLTGHTHTINGGANIKGFQHAGDWQYRVLILSDPASRSGDELDDALYIFHELFHMLEWAYPEADFPKDNHPCNDRQRWPADYVGNTEWDFYQQTFARRMLPLDRMARIRWSDNSNPSKPPKSD